MDDPKRFRFDARDFYLKSAAEMRDVWSELPEACDNTLLVAERCNVEFNEGANLMPRFPVPEGETEESWLVKEVERGLALRFPNGVPDTHRAQAEYEVGVIIQMGFPGYFLVDGRPRPPRQGDRHPGRPRSRLRRRVRSSPTRWASPSSTRSSTACSSSGSSTPSASRCPTSTWTSTSAAAAT